MSEAVPSLNTVKTLQEWKTLSENLLSKGVCSTSSSDHYFGLYTVEISASALLFCIVCVNLLYVTSLTLIPRHLDIADDFDTL